MPERDPNEDKDDDENQELPRNKRRETKIKKDDPEQDDVVVWKYPFGGRMLRVETPAEIPRDVWDKLKSYIDILEPPK